MRLTGRRARQDVSHAGKLMTGQLDAIYIYDAPGTIGLNIGTTAQFLTELLPGTEVETRSDFFTHHMAQFEPSQVEVLTEQLIARLEEREVHNLVAPERRDDLEEVTPEDLDTGVIYLAEPLQDVMQAMVPQSERGPEKLHLVYLEQCIGRFEPGETYLTLQTIQHGEPAIISTTGFVEAPSLPREYSFRRGQLLAFGLDEATEELDEVFAEETFTHGDARITHVATGFALKALFCRMFDELGCEDRSCPLHNVDTHDELVAAHLSDEAGLCDRHTRMLIEARRNSD